MGGSALVRVTYEQIPGIGVLESFAQSVLGLALSAWLIVELYRLLTRGQCDFVTPIVRVGLGFALVGALPSIGAWVGELFEGTSAQMASGSGLKMFADAYEKQLSALSFGPGLAFSFNMSTVYALCGAGLYILMLVVKIVMIDVLWPICMSLVVVLGLVAIPLGVLPGLASISGWVRNLVEVSLWPLIFQMLIGMMASAFQSTLGAVLATGSAINDLSASGTGDSFLLMVNWWALCVGYAVLCLLTPFIAAMAVRGTPVGTVAGMLASTVLMATRLMAGAKFGGLAAGGGARAQGGGGAAFGAAGGAAKSDDGLRGALSLAGPGNAGGLSLAGDARQVLDRRTYAPASAGAMARAEPGAGARRMPAPSVNTNTNKGEKP